MDFITDCLLHGSLTTEREKQNQVPLLSYTKLFSSTTLSVTKFKFYSYYYKFMDKVVNYR